MIIGWIEKIHLRAYLLLALFFPSPLLWANSAQYQVEFRGVHSFKERRALKNASSLMRYKKSPPRSLAALKYRADQDLPEMIEVLHSYSYYDAFISTRAFREPSGKLKMVIAVDKGDPYLLKQFNITPLYALGCNEFDLDHVDYQELGVRLEKPALVSEIIGAEKQLLQLMNQQGFPLAEIKEKSVVVDQAQKTVAVNLQVDEGPLAYFGDLCIESSQKVRPRFIQNRISWKKGELFDSSKVQDTEKALYNSGLFAIVSITHGKQVDKDGFIPMNLEVTESKTRNLIVGGSYTTTWEGLGGTTTWQNRNLFNLGINLKLNYSINRRKQETGIEFLFPDFLSSKQKLVLESEVSIRNDMPNYQEHGVDTTLYVERNLNHFFTTSLGMKFNQFQTEDSLRDGYFSLFGIPFHLYGQSSENVLINPSQGGWASFDLTPYFSLIKKGQGFTECTVQGSVYQHLIPSKRIVLALNAVFGTLFNSPTFNIPPSYRFYEGSPQHLRGYPYQRISPRNINGDEIGGRSKLLFSIEPRFMLFRSIELVTFLDVGNVYSDSWVDWDIAFLKSLGVGVRYFSFIGPLRLDIGFPLNRWPNVKQNYQIYFSIGQAF